MAHLTPPKPEIALYQDGFDDVKDLLERKATGAALSELVERIEDPMVIALDGGWGTGKSFFLKCWVGQHLKEEKHQAQTVYFDAFKHDFIDSPLASLMGVIAERLEDAENGPNFAQQTVQKLRNAALPLTRLALAVASYGATEAGGALFDALTKQASKELDKAAEDFWSRESGTRIAMGQFREALIALTAPAEGSDTPQKLVIVIDELDRCRPDYALSLLEIIKHFFDVPHVHFVLGANMQELQNSVSARYGAGINAGLYLQKFVTLTMRLPEHLHEGRGPELAEIYFAKIANQMGIERSVIAKTRKLIEIIKNRDLVSLRSFERLAAVIAITPSVWHETKTYADEPSQRLLLTLIVMKAWFPTTFHKAINGNIEMSNIETIFKFSSPDALQWERGTHPIFDEWEYYLDPPTFDERTPDPTRKSRRTMEDGKRELRSLVVEYLETFSIN